MLGQTAAMTDDRDRPVSEIFDPSAWGEVPGFDFTDITYHRAVDADGRIRRHPVDDQLVATLEPRLSDHELPGSDQWRAVRSFR